MKKIFLVLLAVLLCFASSPVIAKDWTEFGGSPQRLRCSNEDMGPPITLNWYDLNAGASMSQPLLVGDKIYHLGGSRLLIYDAKFTGTLNQPTNFPIKEIDNGGTPSHSDPTYANSGVYYGTGANEQKIFSLAYYNEGLQKPYLFPLSDEIVTAPLVLDNDTTVIATTDGKLYVVRGLRSGYLTGKSYNAGSGRITASAGRLSGNSFVIGSDADHWVRVYRIITDDKHEPALERLWEFHTDAGVPASISVDGDRVYFSDKNANFYCLRASNGELIWKNTDCRGGFINDSPAVSGTGVFFSIRDYKGHGRVVRLNKMDGRTEWVRDFTVKGANSPVVWAKAGAIIVGDSAGMLHALNGATGEDYGAFNDLPGLPAVGAFQLGGAQCGDDHSRFNGAGTQITLATGNMADGLLLVGANISMEEGRLYCFKLSKPTDLALENAKLENNDTQASVDAKFLLGGDILDTTVAWGSVPTNITFEDIKKKKPNEIKTLLPNTIDVKDFNPNETRKLTVDIPSGANRLVFMINPTMASPQGEMKWDNNYAEVFTGTNLVAVSINPGVEGEAEPNSSYTATVVFKNESSKPLAQVPVGATAGEESMSLKDSLGNVVQYSDFGPGESKAFTFAYDTPDSGSIHLVGAINTAPVEQKYPEPTYADNKVDIDVPVKEITLPDHPSAKLTLQAVSQDRSIKRPAGTAKWTDLVTATLTVDRPKPPKGQLDWWKVTWEIIEYPKQHPEFTFGTPYPPSGTKTVSVGKSRTDGSDRFTNPPQLTKISLNTEFKEDWAMDGANIWSQIEERLMAAAPKKYAITARYKVSYKYTYKVCFPQDGCRWESSTGSYTGTEGAMLLVNGTGVDSRAQ